MENHIKESCEKIETELENIKNKAIKKEFNVEELIAIKELQGFTSKKYVQILKYARRTP